ncbi:MAG: RNA 2',3'-cyclic phosphodiesterase [candidate division WOR-3 bacterium]
MFIGIEIPQEAKDLISNLCKKLPPFSFIKWVEKENLHITLRFLGETDKRTLIEEKMKEVGGKFTPFKVSLKGVGAFPSLKRASVIWVGIEEGKNFLKGLYLTLEDKIVQLGFKKEEREFTPHITLGRVKRGKYSLPEGIDFSFGAFPVDKITLFKSTLRKEGPIYEVLAKFPLIGGNPCL